MLVARIRMSRAEAGPVELGARARMLLAGLVDLDRAPSARSFAMPRLDKAHPVR